jgi:hypothetical protein
MEEKSSNTLGFLFSSSTRVRVRGVVWARLGGGINVASELDLS